MSQTKDYDYDDIKKLAQRINKVQNKKHQIAIFNIIKTMNPNIVITENDSGLLMKFNNLEPQTYSALETYFCQHMRRRYPETSDQLLSSEYIPYSSEEIAEARDKYKLSTLTKKCEFGKSNEC